LPGTDLRLGRRYRHLIASHLTTSQALAAGIRVPPGVSNSFAATQAAWRFLNNPRVTPDVLAAPLLDAARHAVPTDCDRRVLVMLDWSNLHYNGHASKSDRVELTSRRDLGYEMLTALAVSDRVGAPIAPLCVDLRGRDGVHTTRDPTPQKPRSQLDQLEPVMEHVRACGLGKPAVFIMDREADSVFHYRRFVRDEAHFVVRADDNPKVQHQGRKRSLGEVADDLRPQQVTPTRRVLYKGRPARQFVAGTTVTLTRPARLHRKGKDGRKAHKVIAGEAITLRLAVAEVRDERGKRLARWLLLSNLPEAEADASTLALWYYWRWEIESYHKLLKGAGQQLEEWQQQTAGALLNRLLVMAMAATTVWHLARDASADGTKLRGVLVQLSGRQMKRGRGSRPFTEPALLAGLGVLIPMLLLLERADLEELRKTVRRLLPLSDPTSRKRPSPNGGDV
jgi:hypothetical protein